MKIVGESSLYTLGTNRTGFGFEKKLKFECQLGEKLGSGA
jgi:hypothetical protein